MMRLYYAEVLNPRKVCAFAKHLKAPIDYVRVDLARGAHLQPAFRAKNPNAKVPLLEDGSRLLWEADAILCHLARMIDPTYWPSDDRQVDIVRWMSWNQVHFQRFGGTIYFEKVIKPMFAVGAPDEAKVAAALASWRVFAAVLDAHLREREWLVGSAPTVADFTVAAVLPFAEQAELPLVDFPAIARWHAQLLGFEAWRDPYPAKAVAA